MSNDDVYDRIMHLISVEAVRLSESGENTHGLGPGACAGAVMSTLIMSWASMYGSNAEHVIDQAVETAKHTLRQRRAEVPHG
ncbi:MAG: hypothetical protein CMN87_12290 [Stappia sp.]|uniref:hypothetical protein n=1 Tax=Stappia sp. TaxID=1870903 RepID=UPI000C45ABA0|nr:hypothetical protein [Stappia sp.]MAB00142.1 hypothetical protein [Stappia sp.]MBM20781.1 hypothetical protein [Stappia sp.]